MAAKKEKLRKLYRTWNRKLERSGFVDIEKRRFLNPVLDLQERASFFGVAREATEVYYRWAVEKLQSGQFKNLRHQKLWKFHAEGYTGTEIGLKVSLSSRRVNCLIEEIRNYLKEKK